MRVLPSEAVWVLCAASLQRVSGLLDVLHSMHCKGSVHGPKVVRAYPCRRALGSQSGTSVELDPSAEVETRALMSAEDLTPVGW